MKIIKNLKNSTLHNFKSWFYLIFVFTLLGCNSMPSATDKLSVEKTLIINASADEVWNFAGDWAGLDVLAPALIEEIFSDGNTVGSMREIHLNGGGIVEEAMVEKSATSYSYIIVKSPLPVSNYKSTISVKDIGNGQSKFSWKSDFIANGVPDEDAIKIFDGLYQGAVDVIKKNYSHEK
jgi:hypothetical protein